MFTWNMYYVQIHMKVYFSLKYFLVFLFHLLLFGILISEI